VAAAALVLDRLGGPRVVRHLPTNRGLPVRIPSTVRHHGGPPIESDRDVEAPRGGHALVAGEAAVGGAEEVVRGRWGGLRRHADERRDRHPQGPPLEHRGLQGRRGGCGQRDAEDAAQGDGFEIHGHHPSKKPPSNQSSSR
jgi:hypothetical protein